MEEGMSDPTTDPMAEYGPAQVAHQPPAPVPRNKVPTAKHIAYELPGGDHTYTCRPAPSARKPGETEEQWLERTRFKYVPAEAINVRVVND
jgi:hypothetical protein